MRAKNADRLLRPNGFVEVVLRAQRRRSDGARARRRGGDAGHPLGGVHRHRRPGASSRAPCSWAGGATERRRSAEGSSPGCASSRAARCCCSTRSISRRTPESCSNISSASACGTGSPCVFFAGVVAVARCPELPAAHHRGLPRPDRHAGQRHHPLRRPAHRGGGAADRPPARARAQRHAEHDAPAQPLDVRAVDGDAHLPRRHRRPVGARSRCSSACARPSCPRASTPSSGRYATPIGEVYRYTLEGAKGDPMKLRTLQDWVVRPSCCASTAWPTWCQLRRPAARDPGASRARSSLAGVGLTLQDLEDAVQRGSQNASGGVLERGAEQFVIRSEGLFKSLDDIRNVGVDRARRHADLREGRGHRDRGAGRRGRAW